jgi:non-homologous end joining protein Ku
MQVLNNNARGPSVHFVTRDILQVTSVTGEEVASNETMKCYKVDTDTYIEIAKDELENIALSPSLGSG